MKSGLTHRSSDGFTLLEAMLSVGLLATIIMALATITGQWLPNWRRGFADLQRADLLSLGLERIAADISTAEYVSPNGATSDLLFEGAKDGVTFVRSAIGLNERPHLEIIRIAPDNNERGVALVRTRRPFTPLVTSATAATGRGFTDPVVLVRAPFRVSFAYAGPDRAWRDAWGPGKLLPTAVQITVRDERQRPLSTAIALKATATGVPALASDEDQSNQAAAPSDAAKPTTEQKSLDQPSDW